MRLAVFGAEPHHGRLQPATKKEAGRELVFLESHRTETTAQPAAVLVRITTGFGHRLLAHAPCPRPPRRFFRSTTNASVKCQTM